MMPGAAPSVQNLAEQVGENSEVMDLLLDISSHLHVTKAYIARKEEAEAEQTPVRLAQTSKSTFQPSWELPIGQEGCVVAMNVSEEVSEKVASCLRWAPLLAEQTSDEATDLEVDLELWKRHRTVTK